MTLTREEKIVWHMEGSKTCDHSAAQEELKPPYRFVNCPCGFHETWETVETMPTRKTIAPFGTTGGYVWIRLETLLNPVTLDALFALGGNDPEKTSTIISLMIEDGMRARALARYAQEEEQEQ